MTRTHIWNLWHPTLDSWVCAVPCFHSLNTSLLGFNLHGKKQWLISHSVVTEPSKVHSLVLGVHEMLGFPMLLQGWEFASEAAAVHQVDYTKGHLTLSAKDDLKLDSAESFKANKENVRSVTSENIFPKKRQNWKSFFVSFSTGFQTEDSAVVEDLWLLSRCQWQTS